VKNKGYTLIEVLIAGAILLVGIAAAAVLANSMVQQSEANGRVSIAINFQEQAARLYQLGLPYSSITNLLPERCSITDPPADGTITLTMTTASTNISGVGTMERAVCRMIYRVATEDDGDAIHATNDVTIYRPSIR